MEYGSIADWVNILVTCMTIVLSIKFYSDKSVVRLNFFGQIILEEQENELGVIATLGNKLLLLNVYNYSKIPARIRIEGIRNKPSIWRTWVEYCNKRYKSVPLLSEGTFLDQEYKFLEINSMGYEVITIEIAELEKQARYNGIKLDEPIELIIREVRGKVFKYTIRRKDYT